MRHFTRLRCRYQGTEIFRLLDNEGDLVAPFDNYIEVLFAKDYAPATIRRYLDVVANFLDYLTEAGVYGRSVTERDLNMAVNRYVQLRAYADRIRAADDQNDEFIRWAKPIVVNLRMRSAHELGNSVAAINLFLRLSDLLARTEWERAEAYGFPRVTGDNRDVIASISGFSPLPRPQRKALAHASMLANVMRMNPDGIEKPRGLASGRRQPKFSDEDYLDFPILRLADVIAAANTHRDKAIWLLLGATGIRTSEAATLRWSHIDTAQQAVYVDDPNRLRFANNLPHEAKLRFKGRAVSETFFIPTLRSKFFNALAAYVKHEYVAGCGHDFVFQDVRSGPKCGRPFHALSDAARVGTFKRAVARARIPHPNTNQTYTPHSLRHMYGVYLVNYLPVPGGYGLDIKEVQRLMGHRTDTATRHYARRDKVVLSAKLEYADQFVSLISDDWKVLPEIIADRLRHEAEKVQGHAKP